MSFNTLLLDSIIPEVVAGLFFYFLGVVTSRSWKILSKKHHEENLKKNVHLALDLVYEAEEKFPGRKRGKEKLDWAVERYMGETNLKDYEIAEKKIIEVFNLTRYSGKDFLPGDKERKIVNN